MAYVFIFLKFQFFKKSLTFYWNCKITTCRDDPTISIQNSKNSLDTCGFHSQLRATHPKDFVISKNVKENFILTSELDYPSLVAHVIVNNHCNSTFQSNFFLLCSVSSIFLYNFVWICVSLVLFFYRNLVLTKFGRSLRRIHDACDCMTPFGHRTSASLAS